MDTYTAKFFAAGLKRLCRESNVPLTRATITVALVDDYKDTLFLKQDGVPPFTTTAVWLNGSFVGDFKGSPEEVN